MRASKGRRNRFQRGKCERVQRRNVLLACRGAASRTTGGGWYPGVPLDVVSQRIGHASIGVLAERYSHVYADRDADARRPAAGSLANNAKRSAVAHLLHGASAVAKTLGK